MAINASIVYSTDDICNPPWAQDHRMYDPRAGMRVATNSDNLAVTSGRLVARALEALALAGPLGLFSSTIGMYR